MNLDLTAPDHTTLSRRAGSLDVAPHRYPSSGPIDLIVDSTGLSIFGQGQWAAAKHGRRGSQGWMELHLAVDGTGTIVAETLTDANVDDASTGVKLIEQVDARIDTVVADAAYDTRPFYRAAADRDANVVVPPTRKARPKPNPRTPRDRTIHRVSEVGRRRWKKEVGYHRQARVENAVFRYKTIIGRRLRSRRGDTRRTESRIAVNLLNRMMNLGRPDSIKITD